MSWSAVGSPYTGEDRFGSPLHVSVSPTLGNVLVLAISNDFGSGSADLTLSNGGVGSWKQFDGPSAGAGTYEPNEDGATTALGVYLLWGNVTTGGPGTFSMSTSNNGTAVIIQEFAPSQTPTEDNVYGLSNGGASSGNYDAITPPFAGDLYVAALASRYPGNPGGSSPGFSYDNYDPSFIGGMQLVYNLSASGAQAPAWSLGSSSDFATFGAFLNDSRKMMIRMAP